MSYQEPELRREKTARNKSKSPEILTAHGYIYTIHNNGEHYVVAERFDFWPGTGKWISRATKKAGRGVFNLLRELKSTELTGGKS